MLTAQLGSRFTLQHRLLIFQTARFADTERRSNVMNDGFALIVEIL